MPWKWDTLRTATVSCTVIDFLSACHFVSIFICVHNWLIWLPLLLSIFCNMRRRVSEGIHESNVIFYIHLSTDDRTIEACVGRLTLPVFFYVAASNKRAVKATQTPLWSANSTDFQGRSLTRHLSQFYFFILSVFLLLIVLHCWRAKYCHLTVSVLYVVHQNMDQSIVRLLHYFVK